MATSETLKLITEAGTSLWLDDLSRSRITSGNLKEIIQSRQVRGVTTNPSIFAAALSNGEDYREQLIELVNSGAELEEIITELTSTDVKNAADLFVDIYNESNGYDGRVSIEVDPRLANETAATVTQAKELWEKINRNNLMIKIPATKAGIPAITEVLAAGISVNVTLIFSLERYKEVIESYLLGLEKAKANGHDLSKIHSVASFFVSRVDTEVDPRLEAIGGKANELLGQAALANARLAYQLFLDSFATERAKALLADGANLQRPLWASTGVKDPRLPDTLYVTELVAANQVNTVPEKTLEAVFDHGVFEGDTISGKFEEAENVINQLAVLGISYSEVTEKLETEGVAKFIASWNELLETVSAQIEAVK